MTRKNALMALFTVLLAAGTLLALDSKKEIGPAVVKGFQGKKIVFLQLNAEQIKSLEDQKAGDTRFTRLQISMGQIDDLNAALARQGIKQAFTKVVFMTKARNLRSFLGHKDKYLIRPLETYARRARSKEHVYSETELDACVAEIHIKDIPARVDPKGLE